MSARPDLHPTDQTLHAYGLGKLDDPTAESVNKHLESCPTCRRRVAELTSDSFLGRLRDAQARPESHAPLISSTAGRSLLDGGGASPQPPPASTLPPGLADHADYEVIRELGRGGMGVVYLAQNRLMGRLEVFKVVSSHLVDRSGVLDRFLAEIRNAAKLHHPNVVTAYSALRVGESLVLAMEYVDGLDLARLVKSYGVLPVANACNYVHQAALGLQHAHEHGMVHRDIKPGNLMLARQGSRALIKVLDFGLAKVKSEGPTDRTLTHEGQMLGTPDFIAPEQIVNARKADIRADIYSLGCTFYYLLTGGPPFHGDSLYEILQAHHSMEATPLNLARPEVPMELAVVVGKMMAKEPERRFQEPKQVAQALMPFFKKGATGSVGSKPEISQAGQTNAGRPVSVPIQPATDAGRAAVRAEKAAEPIPAETPWKSLIEFREEERPIHSAPAIDPEQRPLWKKWAIALAASLFGLIALGVIIITTRDKKGREISKTILPEGSKFVLEDSPQRAESNPSETGRADAAGSSPVPAAGEAKSPPVGKSTASSTDPLQPGTSWRGTSTARVGSWSNDVDRPRALWLTIKARAGSQFKAVVDSPRGSHDAEGTFKDGVIDWKVAKEDSSWVGKLDGNELVGGFNGTNRGTRDEGIFSGEFQLALADGLPPTVSPARIPPAGPVRGARYIKGGHWTVEGDQLIKEGLGDGFVDFGSTDWTDYDLTYEARKSDGPEGFGCGFRDGGDGKSWTLHIGGLGNKHYLHQWSYATRQVKLIQSSPGTIQPLEWHRIKVSLRGQHIRIELDDHLLVSHTEDFNQRGAVNLRFYDSAGRFRNIKVTAPDGTVLWEGPPDLSDFREDRNVPF